MISVITPTNNTQYLGEAYDSLLAQDYQDWEWIVVPNGGATWQSDDERVRTIPADFTGSIGALKRFACQQARGEIIVELDHDDLLTPTALEQIAAAFDDADVGMAYSNFAEFRLDGSPHTYDERFGWRYQPREFYYQEFQEALTFPPDALSMANIEFAPNHVRAWRTETYWAVGGHDADLPLADDYDLCCRMYLHSKIAHIPSCLYLYRVHGDNVWLRRNGELVEAALGQSDRYRQAIVERWAKLEGLPMIDLGAQFGKPEGYIGVDVKGADITADVRDGLPFPDNSVGVVRAMDFLEHLPDKERTMNEIWRVLVPSGWLLSLTPSTDGRGAFQDPTHVSFWNENSFWYYTDRRYAAYAPRVKCRFQARRLVTLFPSDWHRQHNIPYVRADLAALKDGMKRIPGLVQI